MEKETKTLKDLPTNPGIYLFTNKINNKHYVGQAQNLRKRLKAHYYNCLNDRYDNPLYRAIKKYGKENFKITIIKEIIKEYDKNFLVKILDKLEIYYIKLYDSFGKNGYNQTKGGDGGILGYKMTPEQIEKIRQAAIRNNKNRKEIFGMNIKTGEIFHSNSIAELSKKLNICHSSISRCLSKTQLTPINGLFVFNTINDFTNIKIDNPQFITNSGQFQSKYSLEEFKNLTLELQKEYYHTQDEIAEKLNICKSTVCNYTKELKKKGILLFNSRSKLKQLIVTDIKINKIYTFSIEEAAEYFDTSRDNILDIAKRKSNGSLYKKQFKIEGVYDNI